MWYIDSMCNNRMTTKDIFANLDSLVNSKVKFGNNTKVKAKGKGNIIMETKEYTQFINDVLLVLNFKK